MTDVIVSYKTEDYEAAFDVVNVLQQNGLSVWWDQYLSGERADEIISQQIEAASAVVVLFSQRSVRSDWVRGESIRAGNKVVPVRIDDIPHDNLPTPLLGYDVIDLTGWLSEGHNDELYKLINRCLRLRGGLSERPFCPPPARVLRETEIESDQGVKLSINIESANNNIISTGNSADIIQNNSIKGSDVKYGKRIKK